jgi:hypothetical protein
LQAKVDGAGIAPLIESIRAAQATADANATAIAQAQADIAADMDGVKSSIKNIVEEIKIIKINQETIICAEKDKAALDAPDSGAQMGVTEKAALDTSDSVEKASAVAEVIAEIKARTDEIAEIKTRMDELQKEFDDSLSELDDRFDSMNKSFADELTIGGDWEPASRPASATGEEATGRPESSKRRRADSTAEPTAVRPTQKVADMVKSVTDAYLNSMDLNGRINRKVRDVWAEEGVAHLKMDVDGAGGAAPPADPSQFERRLRLLEVLFFDTTSVNTIDPTAQPAFDTPAPPPGTGNFLADPAAV